MSTVAVVGAGVMGVDVAATLALHGYNVILKDIDTDVLNDVPKIIKHNLRNYKMTSSKLQHWNISDILSRITCTDRYDDFMEASWIIENVTEDIDCKINVYKELAEVCPLGRFAVNTSCIPITKLASYLPHPENVIGMHFMNPVPLIEVVETVKGFHTSEEMIQASKAFLKSLNKTAILVRDFPGFVSNRLSHLLMNEAAFLVQDGVAEPKQIDTMFRKGYAHKMGPLETADLIGLDTVKKSLQILYDHFQDPKFRCCPLLTQMVDAGLLGRKSGRGFYVYS